MMETVSRRKYKRPADQKRANTIRANMILRNQAVVDKFNHLYNVKRLRYDDVLGTLEKEFYISQTRIMKILKNPSS